VSISRVSSVSLAPAIRDLPSFPTRRSSDLRHGVGVRSEWRATAGRESIGSLAVVAAPANGSFRPNPSLGGAGVDLVQLALERKRSEEHTSELQSPDHLVCRLLLEKKKTSTE